MVEIIGGIIVVVLILLWVTQALLFFYLDISNDHSKLGIPGLSDPFRLFAYYHKPVKAKDKKIKKLRDAVLKLSGYTFMIAILYIVVTVILNLQ